MNILMRITNPPDTHFKLMGLLCAGPTKFKIRNVRMKLSGYWEVEIVVQTIEELNELAMHIGSVNQRSGKS